MVTTKADLFWRILPGQRLRFEDFDDGIVMFDALVGATHLINASAAEALAIVESSPGISTADLHARLLERLDIADSALSLEDVDELLWRLEFLNIVCASPQ